MANLSPEMVIEKSRKEKEESDMSGDSEIKVCVAMCIISLQ